MIKKKIEDSENFQIEGKSTKSKTIMNNYKSFKDIKIILGGKCNIIDDTEYKILFEIERNIKFIKKNNRKTFYEKFEMNEKYLNKNIKITQGRKSSKDSSERMHNKTSEDNIIKKIKGYLIRYLEKFVNNFISDKNKKLKHIDYNKNIKNVKKDSELELMQKNIKDILSSEISRKNSNLELTYNEKIIRSMLNDNKNKELFNSVLNLKFIDWINLFTLEKNVSNINMFSKNYYSEIEKKIPNIEDLFQKILENNENDNIYLLKFIYLLYNYENYFVNKFGRIRKKME